MQFQWHASQFFFYLFLELLIIIVIVSFKGAIRDFLVSSLRREPSPICMLKWPERNQVQTMRNTSSACHVQYVMLPAAWYEGTAQLLSLTALKSHLFELYFIDWTISWWRRGEIWSTWRKPLAMSFRKCHILKPEDSSPKRDSNPHKFNMYDLHISFVDGRYPWFQFDYAGVQQVTSNTHSGGLNSSVGSVLGSLPCMRQRRRLKPPLSLW